MTHVSLSTGSRAQQPSLEEDQCLVISMKAFDLGLMPGFLRLIAVLICFLRFSQRLLLAAFNYVMNLLVWLNGWLITMPRCLLNFAAIILLEDSNFLKLAFNLRRFLVMA